MATIYKIELTSHWINYPKEELQKILNEASKKIDSDKGNTIQMEVIERK